MLQVLDRCNTDKPKADDLKAMRELLQATPEVWQICGDLSKINTREVIEGIEATPAIKESVTAGREAMRRELGYKDAPLLEKMLIDHLMLCWLRLQLAEHRYTNCIKEGGTLAQGESWEKRLSAVQRRYLRAVETLGRIRRMKLPTVQVNIGDKQVNVAGG